MRGAFRAFLWLYPVILAFGLYTSFDPLKHQLAKVLTQLHNIAKISPTIPLLSAADTSGWVLFAGSILIIAAVYWKKIEPIVWFMYGCFIKPLGNPTDQKTRLDRFYETQAEVYDSTRNGLLRGRDTMLKLCAAHFHNERRKNPNKPLIWLDIGGGTGWNIEEMNKYFPIKDFDAVYLLDLCEPLLQVARRRVSRHGWTNVNVLCQDATTFQLPLLGAARKLDLVTMSYALSMIPNFYGVVDRIEKNLAADGLIGVCDFYVSGKDVSPTGSWAGEIGRQCNWFTRMFWLHWFEFDHVDLHPSRRHYLEFKFGTVKSYNGRNQFLLPLVIQIPYYVWVGTVKESETAMRAHCAFVADVGDESNAVAHTSSMSSAASTTGSEDLSTLDAVRIDFKPDTPLSSFYYGLAGKLWRMPYKTAKVHKEFRSWIYGFTWEDPNVDMQYLELTENDTVLAITSAGDNVLHYAIAGKPKRIHAVDMNPCQGHLLELKMAAISALDYPDFWKLFGEGHHPDFRTLLDQKLSPFLSSVAYQFWKKQNNASAFDKEFYLRGYSGLALKLIKLFMKLFRVEEDAKKMCEAWLVEKQAAIFNKAIRPVLNNSIFLWTLSNPIFMWNALGVPMNQAKLFLEETTTKQYLLDTIEPAFTKAHLANGAYHYHVCLMRKYAPRSCPLYLSLKGFEALKKDNGQAMDSIKSHTDSIVNVLRRLEPESLTVWIGMDHMDWCTNSLKKSESASIDSKYTTSETPCELTVTIRTLHRALAPGGRAFWRSAATHPWYVELFKREGFKVERLQSRDVGKGKLIDGVNMYASFWKAVKA